MSNRTKALVYLIILQLLSVFNVTSQRRRFVPEECIVHDESFASSLDRVCEDCYNLYREPVIHTGCRRSCFTDDFFNACMDVLLFDRNEKLERIKKIAYLNGRSMSAEIDFLRAPEVYEPNDCKRNLTEFYGKLNSTCHNCQNGCGGGEVYTSCKKNCFVNDFFDSCVKTFVKGNPGALLFRLDYLYGSRVKSKIIKTDL